MADMIMETILIGGSWLIRAIQIIWEWFLFAAFLWFLWCLFFGNLSGLEATGGYGWEY